MSETQSPPSARIPGIPIIGPNTPSSPEAWEMELGRMEAGVDARQLSSLNFPHLDQYLGIWAMEERQFLAGFDLVKRTNLSVHIQQVKLAREKGEKGEEKADSGGGDSGAYGLMGITKSGVAIVSLSGTLMKYQTSMTKSTSTVMMRRTLRMLGKNEDVAGVLIIVDSPGGTVSGTSDLADEVAALAAIKPLSIYVEDLAASAAYWIASQGMWISAGRTSLIGSIGTYAVVEDSSAQAAMEGIKVHVVRAGAYKGSGVEGTAVTAEQLTEIQRIVSGLNQDFLEGVAKGRKMSIEAVKSIADGRVHKAPDALAMKLIDHVESFDAALARLEAKVGSGGGKQNKSNNAGGRSAGDTNTPARVDGPESETAMSSTDNPAGTIQGGASGGKPATIKELRAAFPDDPHFAMDCADKGATLMEAQAAYSLVLQAKLQNRDTDLEKMKRENDELRAKGNSTVNNTSVRRGVQPLGSRRAEAGAGTGSQGIAADEGPGGEFHALVQEKMKLLVCRRLEAVKMVARENPEAHRAYLEAHNNEPKQREIVAQRFASLK